MTFGGQSVPYAVERIQSYSSLLEKKELKSSVRDIDRAFSCKLRGLIG